MIVAYDDALLAHLGGVRHPERADRVRVAAAALAAAGMLADRVAPRLATIDEIARVHPQSYIELVRRECAALESNDVADLSTGDTTIDAGSYESARLASGAALAALEATLARNTASFALVRPPGHHAEPARGMGFCVFGNAAVAARAFVDTHGGRALVVDFDYHHGNGTQATAHDGVSFVSTHAFPAYPGTGGANEQRFDPGGAVVNVPLPPHSYGTEAFVATWQRLLPAVAARVRPDFIVVSAGYDFAAGDPVGDLGVDARIAARSLAMLIRSVAAEYARGRVAYVLEGGYDIDTLALAVAETVRVHDAPAYGLDLADATAIPARQHAIIDAVDAWAR